MHASISGVVGSRASTRKLRGPIFAAAFALPSWLGCTQLLGLDDEATLEGGGGEASAALHGAGGNLPTTAASGSSTTANQSVAESSSAATTGSGGCGTCPIPGQCQMAVCSDSNPCELQPQPAGTPCETGTCDDSAHCIQTGCQMQSDCDASHYCQTPKCLPKKPKHAACQQSFQCDSNDCHNQKCA